MLCTHHFIFTVVTTFTVPVWAFSWLGVYAVMWVAGVIGTVFFMMEFSRMDAGTGGRSFLCG